MYYPFLITFSRKLNLCFCFSISDYILSVHGFDHFLNKPTVGYSDIICMVSTCKSKLIFITDQFFLFTKFKFISG